MESLNCCRRSLRSPIFDSCDLYASCCASISCYSKPMTIRSSRRFSNDASCDGIRRDPDLNFKTIDTFVICIVPLRFRLSCGIRSCLVDAIRKDRSSGVIIEALSVGFESSNDSGSARCFSFFELATIRVACVRGAHPLQEDIVLFQTHRINRVAHST